MNTDQILREQIDSLPDPLKDYVVRRGWAGSVDSISAKYNLNPEQKTALENELLLVILGLELADHFKPSLASQNVATGSVLADLVKDCYDAIFEKLEAFLPDQEEPTDLEARPEELAAPQGSPTPPAPQPAERAASSESGSRPNLPPLQSSYPAGQDPYREPIE